MAHTNIEIIREANGLREMIGLTPKEPIVNIDESISNIGFILAEENFGDNFAAFCTHLERDRFAIVLNKDQQWNENFRRFTISHEIGHLTLIQHRAALQRGNLEKSLPEFQIYTPIEREADYFAINFLAPRQAFEHASKLKDFSFESLFEIGNFFGISVLATAFRFVELTDLPCSLISVDVATGKIKYEKRSSEFRGLGFAEYLFGKRIPPRTNCYDVLRSSKDVFPITEQVNLIDWYPDFGEKIECTESILQLGYNNTLVVLLVLNEDIEK